jgi:hypothetical protein
LSDCEAVHRVAEVGPINVAELRALSPGPLYEGFEEDLKRMRRGLPALGPRK